MKKQHFGQENGIAGQSYGQQLAEIHANALPGVTRHEEGEALLEDNGDIEEEAQWQPRTRQQIINDHNERERSRERERYENYLDEQDSEKLPNAFDMGWRRNLLHLFGHPVLYRFLPICNTSGDGWHWEPNQEWLEAREAIKRSRHSEWQEQAEIVEEEDNTAAYNLPPPHQRHQHHRKPNPDNRKYLTTSNGVVSIPGSGSRSPNKADYILGRSGEYFDRDPDAPGSPPSMHSLKTLRRTRRGSFGEDSEVSDANYVVSSDEDEEEERMVYQGGKGRSEDDPRKRD